jgi:hypothetical protein
MVLMLFFSICIPHIKAESSTSNLWYKKYIEFEKEKGSSYYKSSDSSTLAWGESYLLRSYLDVYHFSNDLQWIEKFVSHVDAMLENSSDEDHDGYLGWTTYRYSPNEIKNSGFELDIEDQKSWIRFQAQPSTIARVAIPSYYNDKNYGEYGLQLKTNGQTWQKMYQKIRSYTPNTKYFFNLFGKTKAVNAEAYIYDRTDNKVLAKLTVDETTWKYYHQSFVTPDAGHDLEIWLGHESYTSMNGVSNFDEINLNAFYPYLVHDAMVGIPIAEFVRVVKNNKNLQTRYSATANKYQSFLENNIVPKWEKSKVIGNMWDPIQGTYKETKNYRVYTSESVSPGTILPYNMTLAFAQMLGILYDVNGNKEYLKKSFRIHRHFKTKLQYNTTTEAYSWKYMESQNAIEDTSHGHMDIASVIDMHRRGIIYSNEDMKRFTNTFMNQMVETKKGNYQVKDSVNGNNTGSEFKYTKTLLNWIELSQFNKNVVDVGTNQFLDYKPANASDFLTIAHILKWADKNK